MSYSIRFLKAAQVDITGAYEWYESKRPGLGEEFAETLEKLLSRILNRPGLFALAKHNARKAVMQRFPYNVFFRVDGEVITIVAVFHTSRRPEAWEEREEDV
jgi:plasmid stabilization system protein ParE